MIRLLCCYPLLVFVLAMAPSLAHAQETADEPTPAERYERAMRISNRGSFTKALEELNRIRNYYRDDPVSVLAELAIADLYYRKGDHEQARLAYQDFLRLHPRHEEAHYVTWRLGQSTYKRSSKHAGRDQTSTRSALSTWAGFDVRYPESEHLDDVARLVRDGRDRLAAKELFIARFYARDGAWTAVQGRAEGVVARYPESRHVPAALALLTEAYQQWGMESQAREARDRLATDFPESHWLARADRVLARPPGQPVSEDVFLRPYRIPGMGPTAPPPQ